MDAANHLVAEIMKRVRALRELPRLAPPWRPAGDDAFRRYVIGGVVVLYRIAKREDRIYVLAVRHGR